MFHDPDGSRDDWVRSHKVGSMEQTKLITKIAGIDVGKAHLDAAVHGMEDLTRVGNAPAGFSELIAWLRAREVGRAEARLAAQKSQSPDRYGCRWRLH